MKKLFVSQGNVLVLLFIMLSLAAGCSPDKETQEKKVSFGLALEGLPASASIFHKLEKETGFPVSYINIFLQWPHDPDLDNFPYESLKSVHSFGAVPILTWEPMYYENHKEYMIPAKDILQGRYDDYIRHFARKTSMLEQPVIIRFAHEMNLSRYHWGGTIDEYGPDAPGRYIAMFRHVSGIFKDKEIKNALFAFCPNNESLPNPLFDPEADWNRARNYYPGHEYVDVLGMDGYNWGTTRTIEKHGWNSRWLTFEEIFRDIYQELKTINPDMPVYVFETSSAHKGGNRNAWIKDAFVTAGRWDIDGVIWFHVDKEEDWRMTGFIETEYYSETLSMIKNPPGD